MKESQAEVLEQKSVAARIRRQDKKDPLLISMTDFILFPNVPNLRKNPDMIVYRGKPDAGAEERRRYVETMKSGRSGLRQVIDTSEPFDVAKASAQELIDFALLEYGVALKPMPTKVLRGQVVKLAQENNALIETSETKQAARVAETADDIS